jgi:hypothetical protein
LGEGLIQYLLPHHVDVRGSFFFRSAVDAAVGAVKRGYRRIIAPPRLLAFRRRLPVSHRSLIGNSDDLRNLNRFYHTPIIGNIASEL